MSCDRHSPGPWSFDATCFDSKIAIRGGVTAYGRPYTVAHVNRPGSAYAGQDYANARLIAAAPALLEALQLHDAYLALPQDRGGPNGTKGRALDAFLRAKAAAITAATHPASLEGR